MKHVHVHNSTVLNGIDALLGETAVSKFFSLSYCKMKQFPHMPTREQILPFREDPFLIGDRSAGRK